jgi:hypothetical protein
MKHQHFIPRTYLKQFTGTQIKNQYVLIDITLKLKNMDANTLGKTGFILMIITAILGSVHQTGMAFICMVIAFYFFWKASVANK